MRKDDTTLWHDQNAAVSSLHFYPPPTFAQRKAALRISQNGVGGTFHYLPYLSMCVLLSHDIWIRLHLGDGVLILNYFPTYLSRSMSKRTLYVNEDLRYVSGYIKVDRVYPDLLDSKTLLPMKRCAVQQFATIGNNI
jgi:hypothetical protein